MPIEGLTRGLLFYLVGFFVVFFIYNRNNFNKKPYIFILLASMLLHFLSSIYYSTTSSDSFGQFHLLAQENFTTWGTSFAKYISYGLQKHITGSNYLIEVCLFGTFGYIGHMLISLTLLRENKYFSHENQLGSNSIMPYWIILSLWPSYCFWPSGIGKDSMCFFALGLWIFALSTYCSDSKIKAIVLLIISLLIIFPFRPYMTALLLASLALGTALSLSKRKLITNLAIIIITAVCLTKLSAYVLNQQSIDTNVQAVLHKSIFQLQQQAKGTHITLPTEDPNKIIFYLPYLIAINTLFPLFIFSNGKIDGLISSLENLLLLVLIVLAIKNFRFFIMIIRTRPVLKYLMGLYFIGMAFVSASNTNLGLAMRHKIFYASSLLFTALFILAAKKQVLRDQKATKKERHQPASNHS